MEARTSPQGGTLARVGLSALLGTNFHKPMPRAWMMQRRAQRLKLFCKGRLALRQQPMQQELTHASGLM